MWVCQRSERPTKAKTKADARLELNGPRSQHKFAVGEYVSVTDEDGRLLTYKVTEVQPVNGA